MSAPAERSRGSRNLETGPCVTSSSIMFGIFHSVKSVGYRLPKPSSKNEGGLSPAAYSTVPLEHLSTYVSSLSEKTRLRLFLVSAGNSSSSLSRTFL